MPGFGTILKAYGGPQDQLTRIWVTGLVDSIGKVNPAVAYAYDNRGRLISDTAFAGDTAMATRHEYDQYERDSLTTDRRGAWRVSYDATRGLPAKLVTPFGDSLTYTYDGLGRFSGRTLLRSGPQVAFGVDYTSAGALRSMETTVGIGGSAWQPSKFDGTGQRIDEGPPIGPVWTWQAGTGVPGDTLVDSVSTDADERLLNWRQFTKIDTLTWGLVGADSADYDSQVNVLTATGSEAYDTVSQRLTSRADAGGTWAYTYDAAGNQTQAQWTCGGCSTRTWVYGYDALDRLVSARYNGTLIARYAYDVMGRRIVKRVYSSTTGGTVEYRRFVYSGGHVAQERDSVGGTVSIEYTWGNTTDDLVGFRVSGTQYYVSTDRLGSVRNVWKRDGTWIMRQSFKPYGERLSRDSSGAVPALRYGWTGREYDAETGMYYFRARYYDLGQRRFSQEDPIGFGGSVNLYAYVDGAATESRDPSGMLKDQTMFGGNPHDWTGSGFSADGSLLCDMFCDMGGGTWGDRTSRALQSSGEMSFFRIELQGRYKAYQAAFAQQKNAGSSSADVVVSDFWSHAHELSYDAFAATSTAYAQGTMTAGLIAPAILSRFEKGLIGVSDNIVQRVQAAWGISLEAVQGTPAVGEAIMLSSDAERVDPAWIIGHEVLHQVLHITTDLANTDFTGENLINNTLHAALGRDPYNTSWYNRQLCSACTP